MQYLPFIVIAIIFLTAVFLISLPVVYSLREGIRMVMGLHSIAAITLWSGGVFLGFFVTAFSPPDPDVLWWALIVRVVWQLGSSIYMGLAILTDAELMMPRDMLLKPGSWIFLAICAGIGALLCLNPLRDLIQGPIILRGTVEMDVLRNMRSKYGGSIQANIKISSPGEADYKTKMYGWSAENAEEFLAKCDNTNDVELLMLQHLDRVLDVRCTAR